MSGCGAVAIGRNEGERLRRCLQSLARDTQALVYVDSGSTDGSVALAVSLGVQVVELDQTVPFTAARARNAGFEKLLAAAPDVDAVMFVDSDCEVVAGWLAAAQTALTANPDLAVVCGRRRERAPGASVYNRLCDMEWNSPVGETASCGGDAVMRVKAFQSVHGYNPTLIAGEEPELCVRLRRGGWIIERLANDMTLHDAAMTRWSQWWKRAVRAGYAYAQGRQMHGRSPQAHRLRETRSIWLWGVIWPLLAFLLAWPTDGWSLVLLAAYPVLAARVALNRRSRWRDPWPDALLYATFCVLAKWPQAWGQIRFLWIFLCGRQAQLIEYK